MVWIVGGAKIIKTGKTYCSKFSCKSLLLHKKVRKLSRTARTKVKPVPGAGFVARKVSSFHHLLQLTI